MVTLPLGLLVFAMPQREVVQDTMQIFGACSHPLEFFSLVFCVVCCELNDLKIYWQNPGQKDQLASYVENYK